jgi:hypothetical protein
MLISNLGALGMDTKKKRPLLANKGTGEKDLNFENENGEIRRGSPKGPKVYKFTASLANGMDIDFESDRDLTDDEIQGLVNEYSKTPSYQQVAQKYAKDKKARDNTPASELGPYDNRRVKSQKRENIQAQLNAEQAKQADIAANRLRPNAQGDMGMDLSPQGIAQSFQRIKVAIPKAADSLGLLMQGLADPNVQPDSFDMREGVSEKGRAQMNPSAKITSAAANVGPYLVPGLGSLLATVQGIDMGGRVAAGEGQQVVNEAVTGLNVFDPNIDPVERGVRAINLLGTIYGGYQVAKGVSKLTRIADVSKQLKVNPLQAEQIVNWAEEASAKAPNRTGINKAGRDDAKGTAASIALGNYEPPVAAGQRTSNVPIPTTIQKPELKPVGGVARTQVGPSPMQMGPMTGATVEGRRAPMKALPAPESKPAVSNGVQLEAATQAERDALKARYGGATIPPTELTENAFVAENWRSRAQNQLNIAKRSKVGEWSRTLKEQGKEAGIKAATEARNAEINRLTQSLKTGDIHPQIEAQLRDQWKMANPSEPVIATPKVKKTKAPKTDAVTQIEPTVSTESKLGNPNEKAINEGVRDVQEGQGIRNEGEQFQEQGNGQKANAFPQEKGQVTAESVGVKSGMQDPHAGKTGVWKGPDADQPIKIEKTLGTKDGRTYVKVEGSNTGIPLDEITVNAPKPSGTRTRASAQKAATAEPTATPKVDMPDPKGAAISNKFFRDQTDADVPDANKQTVQQWIDAAVGAGHNTEAGTKKLVDDVLGGKKRDFTESEGMGIAARLTDLLTEKGTKGIDPARKTAIEAEIQRIAEATKKTGTNQARAFVARAMLIGNDYSPQGVYRSYELAGTGKGPDAGIRAQLDAAIQRNAELTKLLDAKEKGATITKGDIALLDEVARQRGKVRKVQDAQERLDAIRAKRAAGARGMGPSSGKGPRVRGALDFGDVADLKELAGAYAQMGVAKFQHFVDRIRGDFKEEFAHLSDADIAEALSQKTGDARTLEEKIIQQNVARLKREAKYIDENASRPTKDSQRRIKVQEQIDDYENQLKTGVYKDRSKPKMKASVELENLRARRDLARQEIDSQLQAAKDRAEYEAKSWGGKRAHDFRELSRGLVLGADLASSTTQGAYHIFPSPKQSALSFWGGVKAAVSESGLRNELALVRENPNYAIKVKSGLKLDATRGGSSSEFTSTSVGKLPIYKQSNRFLDAQLTLLRSRLWDKYEASYRRLAKVADGQPLTPEDYALISEQVNTTTGAGTGDIARFLTQLSKKSGGVLLAPGYRVSRVKQALGTGIWNAAFVQKNPKMARLFLQDHLVVLGMVGATAGGLKAAGVDVELDPRSTDFLKARNNNQIYDLTFGMAAPLRMMAQAYAGMKASRGENEKDKAASTYQAEGIGSVMDYMISSLAPHVQLINQVATQVIQRGTAAYDKKDQRDLEFKSFGKNVDLTTKDGLGNFMMGMTPITAQQIKEIANAPGMDDKQKALLMAGAIFGISAKVNPPKKEETKEEKQRRLRKPGQRIFDMELPKK